MKPKPISEELAKRVVPGLTHYKQDEAASIRAFVPVKENDDIADQYEQELVTRRVGRNAVFLDTVGRLCGSGGTCLDLGASYGAQYYALAANWPEARWRGCDISAGLRARFFARWKGEAGLEPPYDLIDQYDSLPYKDGEFEVVTFRSALSYYGHERAYRLIEEALRVASRAIVVKLPLVPELEEDLYTERGRDGMLANRGKGYCVEWSAASWLEFVGSKKVEQVDEHPIYVFWKEA